VSKRLIIMIAAAGVVSFAGSFAFAWLSRPAPIRRAGPVEPNQLTLGSQETQLGLPQPELDIPMHIGITGGSPTKKSMSEEQLKNLVYEVRQRMQEYENKLRSLQTREQRLQMAHDTLKKDIENLNNLRVELASIVASLKDERDRLVKSKVEIAQAEKANLAKIAATYDKMDATSASEILTNMCKSLAPSTGPGGSASNLDDAVKILHYMTERTKAKLLAELVTSEPQLAAVLCGKLKQIAEQK